MKYKRLISAVLAALMCISALAGCTIIYDESQLYHGDENAAGSNAAQSVPAVSETVTVADPEPTPEAASEPAPTELTINDDYSSEEILALAAQTELESIDAYQCHNYEALIALAEMMPACNIRWCYRFDDRTYDISASEMTIGSTAGLFEALRYLPNIKKVDLTACSPSFEEMDTLIAAYPDVEFIWIVNFCEFSVRSDITIFSTLCMPDSPTYTSEMLEPLFKYCKHLKALDLGHNLLTDLTMLGTLSELQVLIIADNRNVTDISPLGNLKNLEYLECFTLGDVTDFSCFYELTKMKALNCGNLKNLKSLDFIENMPELETLWAFWFSDRDEINAKIEQHPEIWIKYYCDFGGASVTCCGWRTTDINCAIRQAFANKDKVVEFIHWDNVIYKQGEYIDIAGPWVEHE